MPLQISLLSERLVAGQAQVGSDAQMALEVVADVANLLEHLAAALVVAHVVVVDP
jgi:hypothetical protein